MSDRIEALGEMIVAVSAAHFAHDPRSDDAKMAEWDRRIFGATPEPDEGEREAWITEREGRLMREAAKLAVEEMRTEPEPRTCRWTEDVDGVWKTECDESWTFTAARLDRLGCSHCPYCGGKLVTTDTEEDNG